MTEPGEPLVEGDLYEGAFGPTILLVLTSPQAAAWLCSRLDDLSTRDVNNFFRLDLDPNVQLGASITAFSMRRVFSTRERRLVRHRDGRFTWSGTADEWRIASDLVRPLSTQQGHQYLTSEMNDDAIIEVSRGEHHW